MMSENLLVTNIQRMCMHDGPGIRTTVFMKGCNLHCPWCANPENIRDRQEGYIKDGRSGIYGCYYSPQELFLEIIKDQRFWKYDGGVTFSGGEPLLQTIELIPVLKKLRLSQVHIAVETALYVHEEQIRRIIPYIELFIVDIKILIPSVCQDVLGGRVEVFEKNLKLLQQYSKPAIFRIPCNKEYTMKAENLEKILAYLKEYPHVPVEIFKIHTLGEYKYRSLGLEYRKWDKVSEEELNELAEKIKRNGNNVTVNLL